MSHVVVYMGGSAYCISTPLDSVLGVNFTVLLISHVTSGTLPKSCKASVSSNVKKRGTIIPTFVGYCMKLDNVCTYICGSLKRFSVNGIYDF